MSWPDALDPFTKDMAQVGAWVVAIAGGLVAAFKAVRELKHARVVRSEELRWKKAQLAREVLGSFRQSPLFRDALTMLDWTGRRYEIAPGVHATILWSDLSSALRTSGHGVSFDSKEVYIRDCFDALFDSMEALEHYLRTGLLEFEDVEFPMAYYIRQLREHRDTADGFMNAYGYRLALAFMLRFPEKPARAG